MQWDRRKAPENLEQAVRTLQIIVGAMAVGAATFGVVVYAIARDPPDSGVIARLGMVVGFLALVAQRFVFNKLSTQARTPEQAPQVLLTSTIVSAAILEGGLFFNAIAYLLERDLWSLAMVGLLLAALLMKFPTQDGARAWLEREERRRRDEAARG